MRDGVELERLGLPTAVIVTREFLNESIVTRAALGMQDLEPVVVDHPLSSCTDAEIRQRAHQAVAQVRRVLLGG